MGFVRWHRRLKERAHTHTHASILVIHCPDSLTFLTIHQIVLAAVLAQVAVGYMEMILFALPFVRHSLVCLLVVLFFLFMWCAANMKTSAITKYRAENNRDGEM